MSVFDDVIRGLDDARRRAPQADRHEVEVDRGDIKVRVEADDFDRIGIRVHELTIEGPRPAGELGDVLRRQADAVSGLDLRPLGPLRPQEIDDRLGAGVLRTAPDSMHRGYFFEAVLDQGDKVKLRRHRRDPQTHERSLAPFAADAEMLDELVDGFAGALKGPPTDAP